MLRPDIITIVATISGEPHDLATHLERNVDPNWEATPGGDATGRMVMADFDFEALAGLHCCGFVVIPAARYDDVDLPAYLVMEATFDGPVEDFIEDLVDSNLESLIEVYRHCDGFPASAREHRGLLTDYLRRHSIPHNTYFSGLPGRSVAEIKTEDRLRSKLSRYLFDTYANLGPGGGGGNRPRTRLRKLQRELRDVARGDAELRMVEAPPMIPWAVRSGFWVALALLALLVAIFSAPVWLIASLFDRGWAWTTIWLDGLLVAGSAATLSVYTGILIFLVWLPASILHTSAHPAQVARDRRGLLTLMSEMTGSVMVAVRIALFMIAAVVWFRFAREDFNIADAPARDEVAAVVLGLICLAIRSYVGALDGRAWRQGAFVRPPPEEDAARLARRRIAQFTRYGLALVAYTPLMIVWDAFDSDGLWLWLLHIVIGLAGVLIFALAGWFLMLAVKLGFFAYANRLQNAESRHFANAGVLLSAGLATGKARVREEHRTQLDQNHFASVTFVKGNARRLFLRTALTTVNFLARYVDNKGTLGGIPTIFSARWLLLDRGRRLLFLTNYVGAWDSYLGEFSDLDAFIGVNAIWSNTYVQIEGGEARRYDRMTGEDAGRTDKIKVGFPVVHWLLWGGAAYEQSFKAYVRQSQIPTLAWYGAYPRLSVPNINSNTEIRRDLFRTLTLAELDRLLKRI